MIVPLVCLTYTMTCLCQAAMPAEILMAERAAGPTWARHTIDDSSRGADGVGLGDIDGDGLSDIVTGWEESGEVKVYRNPGPANVRKPWPRVTVGKVAAPEDAVFVDFDGDGSLDVVSCCEGSTRTVFLHRLKSKSSSVLDESQWTTQAIPATQGKQAWMQALPLKGSGPRSPCLVLGSKNDQAAVGLLRLPVSRIGHQSPGFRKLRDAGWIMSLIAQDLDSDGDPDVVLTDRKGVRTGAFWLENPNDESSAWKERSVGALGREAMFADLGDIDGDGRLDLAVAVKPRDIVLCFRKADGGWDERIVRLAPQGMGEAKAVKIADLNGDGRADLVFTCEGAQGDLEGIVWLEGTRDGQWKIKPLGGPAGTKFDLIRTLDLDDDGDLDVLTCEEKDGLGVIWYENPRNDRR